MRRAAWVVAIGLLVLAGPAGAQSDLAVEKMMLPVKTIDGVFELEAMIVRPPGPGPFPLAVITHGGATNAKLRESVKLPVYRWAVEEFARRGYATVFALRAGYGSSQGFAPERRYTRCDFASDLRIVRMIGRQVAGTIEAVRNLPYVDASRIVAVGESLGGAGVLAMGEDAIPGLRAIINFSGGIGYHAFGCDREKEADAFSELGRGNQLPTLWVYAGNDRRFSLALARQLFSAYRSAGGNGQLIELPSFTEDGHTLFILGAPKWRPAVHAFLRGLGLPYDPPPSSITYEDMAAYWALMLPEITKECDKNPTCETTLKCVGEQLEQKTLPLKGLIRLYDVTATNEAVGAEDSALIRSAIRSCQPTN